MQEPLPLNQNLKKTNYLFPHSPFSAKARFCQQPQNSGKSAKVKYCNKTPSSLKAKVSFCWTPHLWLQTSFVNNFYHAWSTSLWNVSKLSTEIDSENYLLAPRPHMKPADHTADLGQRLWFNYLKLFITVNCVSAVHCLSYKKQLCVSSILFGNMPQYLKEYPEYCEYCWPYILDIISWVFS